MNGFQQNGVRIEWRTGCRNTLPHGLGLAPGKDDRGNEDKRYPSHGFASFRLRRLATRTRTPPKAEAPTHANANTSPTRV